MKISAKFSAKNSAKMFDKRQNVLEGTAFLNNKMTLYTILYTNKYINYVLIPNIIIPTEGTFHFFFGNADFFGNLFKNYLFFGII